MSPQAQLQASKCQLGTRGSSDRVKALQWGEQRVWPEPDLGARTKQPNELSSWDLGSPRRGAERRTAGSQTGSRGVRRRCHKAAETPGGCKADGAADRAGRLRVSGAGRNSCCSRVCKRVATEGQSQRPPRPSRAGQWPVGGQVVLGVVEHKD